MILTEQQIKACMATFLFPVYGGGTHSPDTVEWAAKKAIEIWDAVRDLKAKCADEDAVKRTD